MLTISSGALSENDETALAIARERQHSTKKKNPKRQNAVSFSNLVTCNVRIYLTLDWL